MRLRNILKKKVIRLNKIINLPYAKRLGLFRNQKSGLCLGKRYVKGMLYDVSRIHRYGKDSNPRLSHRLSKLHEENKVKVK